MEQIQAKSIERAKKFRRKYLLFSIPQLLLAGGSIALSGLYFLNGSPEWFILISMGLLLIYFIIYWISNRYTSKFIFNNKESINIHVVKKYVWSQAFHLIPILLVCLLVPMLKYNSTSINIDYKLFIYIYSPLIVVIWCYHWILVQDFLNGFIRGNL